MDTDFLVRMMEHLNKKLDDLSHTIQVIENDVSAVKTRLFNGITDTTRETYSKVIVLENKQQTFDNVIDNMQKTWTEKFTAHDTKERLYHTLLATILAFFVTVFAALLVFELEKYHMLKIMAQEIGPSSASTPRGLGGAKEPAPPLEIP